MQEKNGTFEGAKPHLGPYRYGGRLAPPSRRGGDLNPRSMSDRLKLPPATLLARLEAENTALRNRAVELALHIQELAEQRR
jgi:hypothetical protein